jgi:hypothetical protein
MTITRESYEYVLLECHWSGCANHVSMEYAETWRASRRRRDGYYPNLGQFCPSCCHPGHLVGEMEEAMTSKRRDKIRKVLEPHTYADGAAVDAMTVDVIESVDAALGPELEALNVDSLANDLRELCYGDHRLGPVAAAEAIVARFGVPAPTAREERLVEALGDLKRGDCWCEVAIGNSMSGGKHSAACQYATQVVAEYEKERA